MITERQVTGKIEVLENGCLQLRHDCVVERDGVEIARTFHRRVLAPSDSISKTESKDVQAIAAVIWTPERVAAYKSQLTQNPLIPSITSKNTV